MSQEAYSIRLVGGFILAVAALVLLDLDMWLPAIVSGLFGVWAAPHGRFPSDL